MISAHPYYSYGLTQRASDDIHFIARFTRIMIWVWIVLAVMVVGWCVMVMITVGSLAFRIIG